MADLLPSNAENFPLVLSFLSLVVSAVFSLLVILTPCGASTGRRGEVAHGFHPEGLGISDEEEEERNGHLVEEGLVGAEQELVAEVSRIKTEDSNPEALGISDEEEEEDRNGHLVKEEMVGAEQEMGVEASRTKTEDSKVLLSWRDVCCSYPAKQPQQPRLVTLDNSFGEVVAGELTAIMGPSGCGKTTLLNILSGRKAVGKITGEVSIHGTTTDMDRGLKQVGGALRRAVAYVPQDEAFFPMQTPKEAVEFVAKLQHGPHGYQRSEIHAALREVGLGDPRLYGRRIGGSLAGGLSITGLSGGEKKRLALACALIMKPKLIMLDEVTSGLDSENALITIGRVRQACHQRSVAAVVVIHQPNGYIFETFDRLILLSHGKTIFSDHVLKLGSLYKHHFARKKPTSKHELPVDLLERSKVAMTSFTPQVDADNNRRPFVASDSSFEPATGKSEISSFWKLRVVFQRNLINHYVRNYTNVAARLFCYGACSVLDGAIFWQIGIGGRNPSMIGAFIFILLLSYLLPFCSIPVFVHDKKFFLSERSLGLYSPWIYCHSQTLLEMWVLILAAVLQSIFVFPMAGAWNDEVDNWITFLTLQAGMVASGLTGSAMVLFFCILLPSQDLAFIASSGLVCMSLCISGGFVPFNQIGSFVSWLQWISPCKYSLQSLALSYYKGDYGEAFVESVELDRPYTVSANIGVLFLMYAAFSLSTLIILSKKREVR